MHYFVGGNGIFAGACVKLAAFNNCTEYIAVSQDALSVAETCVGEGCSVVNLTGVVCLDYDCLFNGLNNELTVFNNEFYILEVIIYIFEVFGNNFHVIGTGYGALDNCAAAECEVILGVKVTADALYNIAFNGLFVTVIGELAAVFFYGYYYVLKRLNNELTVFNNEFYILEVFIYIFEVFGNNFHVIGTGYGALDNRASVEYEVCLGVERIVAAYCVAFHGLLGSIVGVFAAVLGDGYDYFANGSDGKLAVNYGNIIVFGLSVLVECIFESIVNAALIDD